MLADRSKTDLLKQLEDPQSSLIKSLTDCYTDQSVVAGKVNRIKSLLEESTLDPEQKTIITRCPGRISLSKHADYINSDLLYTLDNRDIFTIGQIEESDQNKLVLKNQGEDFQDQEINLENPELNAQDWSFYPIKIYQELQKYKASNNQKITLVYNSDLPAAGGLSSSHALMLSTSIALIELLDITALKDSLNDRFSLDNKIFEIIELCQRVENQRGFSSGLGDQSAQLLSQKNKFSFIKLFPELKVEYKDIDNELSIVTAPSFIKADKSLPEFQEANENIKNYKKINEIAQEHSCKYLADLIYKYSDSEIFKILESISDRRIRGLALYGLAEASRVKELKESFNTDRLGKHLNLSHQAERNFQCKNEQWCPIPDSEKNNYEFNPEKKLAEHSGLYLASTLENDQIQYQASKHEASYGATISGAGLGGNNSIACKKSLVKDLVQSLKENYYKEKGLEKEAELNLHICSSSNAASRIA